MYKKQWLRMISTMSISYGAVIFTPSTNNKCFDMIESHLEGQRSKAKKNQANKLRKSLKCTMISTRCISIRFFVSEFPFSTQILWTWITYKGKNGAEENFLYWFFEWDDKNKNLFFKETNSKQFVSKKDWIWIKPMYE